MSVLYIILVAIYIASIVGCVHVSEHMSPSRGRCDKAAVWAVSVFWPIVALVVFVFAALRGGKGSKSGKFH